MGWRGQVFAPTLTPLRNGENHPERLMYIDFAGYLQAS